MTARTKAKQERASPSTPVFVDDQDNYGESTAQITEAEIIGEVADITSDDSSESQTLALIPYEQQREIVLDYRLPAEQHPAAVYLASLASGSRRTMAGALNLMAGLLTGGRCDADALDWSALRFQHTTALRAALDQKFAPATTNKCLAALRGVLKAAWNLEQMATEDYHRAINVQSVRGATLPRGRGLSAGELRALFLACAGENNTPAKKIIGARDAALLAVLYGAGLRRAEAVALSWEDYDPTTGALTIRSGKGRKDRTAYVNEGSQEALEAWLAWRGDRPGPLFLPVLKSGRIVERRLVDQTVRDILTRRAQQAKVRACSPHDFRRSFVSDLLDAGADITTVQKLAGHADPRTTSRYDRRGEVTKQKASKLLHVPFVP